MAKHCNPADPCAVYFAEIEQLEAKLRNLRERANQARRAARNKHAIYWAHVSEVQHLNTKLAELLECWQLKVNGKAVVL
jgi:hypothetical protein